MSKRTLGWCSLGVALLFTVLMDAGAQEGSIQEAIKLNQQVLQLYGQGRHGEAIPLAQRALAIREKALGPDHPDTALSLNNLAELYRATGAYAKAEPLYQRALAIIEKALGPEHPYTALSLNNLAELYRATGAYAKAEPLYQRALAINEKALGPEHPDTATSLNNLAALYRATGAYAKAEPLYQRALAIREKALGREHPDTANSLNNLAALYRDTGAYAKAEPLFQRALAIREKALGPEHPDTADSLNNLAELYNATGAYAKAEPLYQRALAIHEKALGREHPGTANSLNNLAELHRATGAYAKAEPLFQRALAIREKALGREHPGTANSLNNLAELYCATGAYAKAEPLFQRALAIREKALGPEHPDTADSLNDLAILSWAADESAKATPLLERAQVIQENNAGRFLLSGSEVRKQAYLQKLRGDTFVNISFSLAVAGHQAVALGLTNILQYKGRVLDAMSDSVARLRQSVRPEDSKLFEQFAEVAQQLSTLTFQGPGNRPPEVYRKRLEELTQQQERLETELSNRRAEFRQQVAPITIAGVQQAIPRDAVLVEWLRYEPFLKGKDEKAKWGKPRYMAYVLKREGEPVVVDVGEAEAIESLVLDFRKSLSEPKSAFVKEIAKELSEKLLGPLRAQLGNTERLLISPDGALNLLPFAALLDDKGEYLAKRFEITYLTSGRDLLRLASASSSRSSAVVVADPDYGKSASMLAQVDTSIQPQRSNDLDRGGIVFKSLAGTVEEAKALKALLKLNDQNVLIGANATEAKLKQLHGPRILHIATHGFFLSDKEISAATIKPVGLIQDQYPVLLGENPLLRSGLALAGANPRRSGTDDDGILTAAEAAQLDLRGTQLVVLSACETGVGDVQNGEGVYGLRRALVLAGAQTQVASLWKVADSATKDLMLDYYERLLNGAGRSAALRDAQRTMINSQERSHPYFWAAFVPIGNWAPLAADR